MRARAGAKAAGRLASFAALLLTSGGAMPTLAAGPDDPALAPCRQLADAARRPSAGRWAEAMAAPSPDPDPLLAPALSVAHPYREDAILAADRVVRAATRAAGGAMVRIERLPQTPIYRARFVQGELRCATDAYVRRAPNGRLTQVPGPPLYGDLCAASRSRLGAVGGKPAVIESEHRLQPGEGMDYEVTPWAGDRWGPSCRVSLRFHTAFQTVHQVCDGGPACAAATDIAPRLAERFDQDRTGASLAAAAPPPLDRIQALKPQVAAATQLFNNGEGAFVTIPGGPAPDIPPYGPAAPPFPILLAGRAYIGRVGLARVEGKPGVRPPGGDARPDFLVAFYSPEAAGLKPVAGFVVHRQATALDDAVVSVPQPLPPRQPLVRK